MKPIYYYAGKLHTARSLPHARQYAANHTSRMSDLPPPPQIITLTDNPNDALGCVMIYRPTGEPLAGRRNDGAQLTHDLPPRLYATPDAAAIAIHTINVWPLADFQVMYVHPTQAPQVPV